MDSKIDMDRKGKYWKEKLFVLFITLIFVSPVIFVKSSLDLIIIYIIGSIGIGQSFGKGIVNQIIDRKIKNRNSSHVNLQIFIYTLIYFGISIFLYSNLLEKQFLMVLLLIQFSSYLLYSGFKAIMYKRSIFLTGIITNGAAVASGIFRLIFSFIVLIMGIMFKGGIFKVI